MADFTDMINTATESISATYEKLGEYQRAVTDVQMEKGAVYEALKDCKDKAKQL